MKLFSKISGLIVIISFMTFVACDKTDVPATHQEGTASVLSSSTTTIAVAPPDADKIALEDIARRETTKQNIIDSFQIQGEAAVRA